MTRFSLFQKRGLVRHLQLAGVSITYTPASGSPTTFLAIMLPETSGEEVETKGGVKISYKRNCSILRDDIDNPLENAAVTYDSTEYTVNKIMSRDENRTMVELIRVAYKSRGQGVEAKR